MPLIDPPRPWSPALAPLRAARLHTEPGTGPLVLMHQGFLIETAHVWRRFTAALQSTHRSSATVEEHYLRTIDSAHALGHDPDLALAQSLAAAVDDVQAPAVDVVAEGTGAAPALLLALNDARVRRVVLWHPSGVDLDETGSLTPTGITPQEMTDAEVSIGILCSHAHVDVLAPSPGVRLDPAQLHAPVLIIDEPDAPQARALHERLPESAFLPAVDRQRILDDDLLIKQAIGFLAVPVAHGRH